MPQNTNITVPANTWTQLTDADVTSITFQHVGKPGADLLVKATTDATAPTDATGALFYPYGMGERNVALSDLFPGISSRDRLWAFSSSGTTVMVSHA